MSSFLDTWRNIITNPTGFFKNMPKSGTYVESLEFAAINSIAGSSVTSLIIYIGHVFDTLYYGIFFNFYFREDINLFTDLIFISIIFLLLNLIVGIASIFISTIIFHIYFKLMGGKGTYEGTLRQITYSTAPVGLLIIPFIQILWFGKGELVEILVAYLIPILIIYSLFLLIIGGKYVHNISKARSIIAVFIPTVINGGIFLWYVILLFTLGSP